MMTNTLSSFARVGGLILLMCLSRSQAQPLMQAVHAGNVSVMGWALLCGLALTSAVSMLSLMQSMAVILIRLICYPTEK